MGQKLADGLSYPPGALRADRAAAYLSMSTSTFLKLVDEKRLPKGKRLGGITFWSRHALDNFIESYEGEGGDEADAVDAEWRKMLE